MSETKTLDPGVWRGADKPFKASYGKLMMWFFLLSDAFTFSSFLVAYGVIRFSSFQPWADPEKVFTHFVGITEWFGAHPPLAFVGLMTFILIASSVTMVLAVEAGHRMDKKSVEKFMIFTIIGGVLFLSCQAYEWYHFIVGTHGFGGLDGAIHLEGGAIAQFIGHHGHNAIEVMNGKFAGEHITAGSELFASLPGVGEWISQGGKNFIQLTSGEYMGELIPITKVALENGIATNKLLVLTPEAVEGVRNFAANAGYAANASIPLLDSFTMFDGMAFNPNANDIVQGASLGVNQYSQNPSFANLFFFITGFHGTHVASGVFINILIYRQAKNGVLHRRGHYEMVEKVGLYWHFVDLVWVFVFTFFYLV